MLALFLGPFGLHADYLDNPAMANMIRLTNLGSLITGVVGFVGSILIFPITLVLLSLAEFVLMEALILLQAALYILATEERFQRRYVVEKKWF